MAVSALVVTLPGDPAIRALLLDRLARDPRVTLGEAIRDRLPIITETASAREGAALVGDLEALAGVRVDVVAIDLTDEAAP